MMNRRPGMPAPQQPQTEGYPNASDMPELSDSPQAGTSLEGRDLAGKDNPVLSAIRTLGMYVQAAQQNNNPNAAQLMESLKGFMDAMLQSGGQDMGPVQAGGDPGAPGMGEQMPPADAPASPMAGPEQSMDLGGGIQGFDPMVAPEEPQAQPKKKKNNRPTQVLI